MSIFRIHFKTPDAVYYAISDMRADSGDIETAKEVIEKFVQYGECVTIEFDSEKQTAIVIPVR